MHFDGDAVNCYFPVFIDFIKTNEYSDEMATKF